MTRGLVALTTEQKARLLGDPWTLSWVHSQLWQSDVAGAYVPIARERPTRTEDNGGIRLPAAA